MRGREKCRMSHINTRGKKLWKSKKKDVINGCPVPQLKIWKTHTLDRNKNTHKRSAVFSRPYKKQHRCKKKKHLHLHLEIWFVGYYITFKISLDHLLYAHCMNDNEMVESISSVTVLWLASDFPIFRKVFDYLPFFQICLLLLLLPWLTVNFLYKLADFSHWLCDRI